MKRIEALIRPEKLCEMTNVLLAVGVDDFTISEVCGSGCQPGQKRIYRGGEYTVDFVSRTRLEVLVCDELYSDVVETILTTARTGAAGDGMILVHNYSDTIPADLDDASGAAGTSASLPGNEQAGVSDEPALSRQRMAAVAIITGLIKLLGLAGARWHDFVW
jgi:nitrogen regulatory protein P-II 1